MKNLLLAPIFLLLCFSLTSQTKNWQNVQSFKAKEKIGLSQKSALLNNSVAWSNDFSQAADWSTSNQTSDNQNFVISTSAPQGTYSAPLGILNSLTPQNGFALFDSDFLGSSGGTQNACICIVNPIDLSNYQSTVVRFYQKFRKYQNEHTYVQISTNGFIWYSLEVNTALTPGTIADNLVEINISQWADNESTVYLRFQYVGSWEYAWEIDDVSIEGLLANPPQIVSITPASGTQGESLQVSLSGQFTHFNQGSETVWFEQATSTIGTNTPGIGQTTTFSGSNIVVNSATSMDFDVDIPVTTMAGLYDAKVQNPTDGIVTKADAFEVFPILPPASWNFTNTGNNHSILIPDAALITLDSVPLPIGSYIGVFYDSAGTLACGGYMQWLGVSDALTAWGDDPGTTHPDGFASGEAFTWKVFDYTTGTEAMAMATYQTVGFPNTGNYATNGISGISALAGNTLDIQTLNIPAGWSIFSTYINPVNPDIETVFTPILSNLTIIKDGAGVVYWPPFVNLIGNMTIGEGYQINVTANSSLDIAGQAVVPELTPIVVPAGWSIVGYLRQSPASIVDMMSPILTDLVIVKDGVGSVYWPVWGVNSIGNMDPGEGYQIRVNNTVNLTYPANAAPVKGMYTSTYEPVHYSLPQPGSSSMNLLLPASELGALLRFGDEIAVVNHRGDILGATVYTGNNTCLTIWGSDEVLPNEPGLTPGEHYKLNVWKNNEQQEFPLLIEAFISGSDRYEKNALAVAGKLTTGIAMEISDPYPNPANVYVSITVKNPASATLSINMYSADGKLIQSKNENMDTNAEKRIQLNVGNLPTGLYYIEIEGGKGSMIKKLNIIR